MINNIECRQNPSKNKQAYTVSEICELTRLKKKQVYDDIHNGDLVAFKKGNKYYITIESYHIYCRLVRRRNMINLIFSLIFISLVIGAAIYFLYKFNDLITFLNLKN